MTHSEAPAGPVTYVGSWTTPSVVPLRRMEGDLVVGVWWVCAIHTFDAQL